MNINDPRSPKSKCGSLRQRIDRRAQRMLLQCDIFPPVRPLIEALAWTIRLFDFAVIRQYDTLKELRPAILFEHDRKRLAKVGVDDGEFGRIFERAGYTVVAPVSLGGVFITHEYRFDGKGAKRDMLALPV